MQLACAENFGACLDWACPTVSEEERSKTMTKAVGDIDVDQARLIRKRAFHAPLTSDDLARIEAGFQTCDFGVQMLLLDALGHGASPNELSGWERFSSSH